MSAIEKKYNTRSPAVKRLMREAAELNEATSDYHAQPLQDNLFEWHFTVRGPQDTDFQGGVYHGRIIVPAEYPMKPPDIIVLTPNGRFEVGKKICLSISGFHPESWQPSWSIRTALLAIIGFMPTPGQGTIGSLDYPSDERQRLARRSAEWACPDCGRVSQLLPAPEAGATPTSEEQQEMREIVQNMAFKSEEEVALQKAEEIPKDVSPTPTETDVNPPTVSTTSSSSVTSSSPATSRVASTVAATTTTTTSTVSSVARVQQEISRSNHMFDLMILVLVAAIAAILYRRFNWMQDSGDEPLGGPTE